MYFTATLSDTWCSFNCAPKRFHSSVRSFHLEHFIFFFSHFAPFYLLLRFSFFVIDASNYLVVVVVITFVVIAVLHWYFFWLLLKLQWCFKEFTVRVCQSVLMCEIFYLVYGWMDGWLLMAESLLFWMCWNVWGSMGVCECVYVYVCMAVKMHFISSALRLAKLLESASFILLSVFS